jgi:hypothetical protein
MRCRDAVAGSLTDRRSGALSPVDGRHAPGNRREERQASRAMTRRHLGCISNLTATDIRMVHK